jgi:hypothetical protein
MLYHSLLPAGSCHARPLAKPECNVENRTKVADFRVLFCGSCRSSETVYARKPARDHRSVVNQK